MSQLRQPNIVFILADDLGWCDLGADGSNYYESPHLDRLAQEGMRFTQGYASCQVCSPSRASILTGKYPPRHGITDYIGAPVGEAWRQLNRHTKLLPPDYDHALRSHEITFPQVLREAGYRTFFAGKWHLGSEGAYPEDFGFEINKGGWDMGSPKGGYFSPWENPKLDNIKAGESLPLRLGTETAHFIEANRDEPFLAYLSFYSVHSPIQTSKDRWEKFRRKAVAQGRPDTRFIMDRYLPVRQVQDCPIYAGMIEAMDEAVGLVISALERHDLLDNTIVIFTSDNGGVSSGDAFASSMLPLRGGKGRQWEGGIRVPLYIRYPHLIASGTICDIPFNGIDFYPTLLELTGLEAPAAQQLDGQSFAAALRGESADKLCDRDLFWHYPHYGNQGGEPSSIIRRGDWKLITYYEDQRNELYNLADDPGEQSDLAAEHPDRVAVMRDRLLNWLQDMEAAFPAPDPLYDAAAEQARLQQLEHEKMPELEAQHACYLDPVWQPNEDWWGSMVTRD